MDGALRLEGQYFASTSAGDQKRRQLRNVLDDFWLSSDEAFQLADQGHEETARYMIRPKPKASGRLLHYHALVCAQRSGSDRGWATGQPDLRQSRARHSRVDRCLFLVALGTGLYTLQANRKTFDRLHHLAERLQTQSEELRMLSWKLIDVQEKTLRQVARDLHDEFGQILTAIGVTLGRASQKALDKDPVFVEDVRRQEDRGRHSPVRSLRVADFPPGDSGRFRAGADSRVVCGPVLAADGRSGTL